MTMDSDTHKRAAIAVSLALFGVEAWRRWKERRQKQKVQEAREEYISLAKEKIGAMGADVKVLTEADEEEAMKVLVASFGGTETTAPERVTSAVLGPKLAKWNSPGRQAWYEYFMSRIWISALSPGTGVVIGILGKDKTLGAVCIAKPLTDQTGSKRSDPVNEGAVWADPKPREIMTKVLNEELGEEAEAEGKVRGERGKAYFGMCGKLHQEYAPGPHWYVNIMAVNPECQRQGMAQRALGVVSKLADEIGVPCYLESAGVRNKLVYEKAGYRADRGFEMNHIGVADPPLDELNDSAITKLYGMVRPAAKH